MFDGLPTKFDYVVKRLFGQDLKILKDACNRVDMSCCGGGGPCCKSMFLHVNNFCNSRCTFCIAETGPKSWIQDFTKLEGIIKELVDSETISKVVLTGGEPLLHPQFARFLTLLDQFDLRYYSLNTNGTMIKKYIDLLNASKIRHINVSMHHYDDGINAGIMGKCLTWRDLAMLRDALDPRIEMRTACTITEHLYTEKDIVRYANAAKNIGIPNVIFRNEYRGFNKYLEAFQRIWGDQYTADICNCGYKNISGVNAEYRQSNVRLKQDICDADLYYRDFIYKDDDKLSGSWEYGSQIIC